MRLSRTASELAESGVHPAWERFSKKLTGEESVLLIHAPAGTGRRWFAESWASGQEIAVIHLSSGSGSQVFSDAMRRVVSAVPRDTPRLAFVMESLRVDWGLLAQVSWVMATSTDVLLTQDEVETVLRVHERSSAESAYIVDERINERAGHIYQAVGGFLGATLVLVKDLSAYVSAARELTPVLSRWADHMDSGWLLATSAFLPSTKPDVLREFFKRVEGEEYGVDALLTSGLLRTDSAGGVFMPQLIRRSLRELVQRRENLPVQKLTGWALESIAEADTLATAIEFGMKAGHWTALADLLVERWADLITADGPAMRRVLSRLPTITLERIFGSSFSVVSRAASTLGPDEITFLIPTAELDYSNDHVAHQLRAQSEQTAFQPGAYALTASLLELLHLRYNGHYAQLGEATRRMRAVLARSLDVNPVRPAMAGVVEVQAGICLQIAGDYASAESAYRAGHFWAEEDENPYLHAFSSGNLALLEAQNGATAKARHWLQAHRESISQVEWGRSMVARGADIAGVLIALAELDFDDAYQRLESLPSEPDHDELWAAHALAIALSNVFRGKAQSAADMIEHLRQSRGHAARSPLAAHLLSLADCSAQLMLVADALKSKSAKMTSPADLQLVRLTNQLVRLISQFSVGAKDVATTLEEISGIHGLRPRWRHLASAVQWLMGEPPSDRWLTDLVKDVVTGKAELIDLAIPYLSGRLEQAGLIERLESLQRNRLEQLPRLTWLVSTKPELTERELSVLKMLRAGKTRREIAQLQFRSENTVKSQIRSLYKKLDATSMEDALKSARRWGL